jgi:hypothetical protein
MVGELFDFWTLMLALWPMMIGCAVIWLVSDYKQSPHTTPYPRPGTMSS